MSEAPILPHKEIIDGPTPKHAQLREILAEVCRTTLKPGDPLPGERLLEDFYGVSRITVRRAIGDLVAAGRLRRVRGKGTFVAPDRKSTRLNSSHVASSYAVFCLKNEATAAETRPGG